MMDKEDGMSITVIFRIALVGILVTMLNQILKQSGRDEIAIFNHIIWLDLGYFIG